MYLSLEGHYICCFLFYLLISRPWQQVTVPVWGRLDRLSGWAELAEQAALDAVVEEVASFQPSAILGVDWSSLPAYKALATALQAKGLHVPPYIYMNYRCLSTTHMTRSCWLFKSLYDTDNVSFTKSTASALYTSYCPLCNMTLVLIDVVMQLSQTSALYRVYLRTCLPEDAEFMQGMESAAAATAAATVALSRSDADFIKQQLLPPQKPAASVKVCMLCILHAVCIRIAAFHFGT